MKYLQIRNDGVLDSRLLTLMGGTTKRDDKTTIGEFGTGLKYSLAYLLSKNIDVKIFLDTKQVKLETKLETIKNTDFEILYIDGERTSVTTSMAHKWKLWYIIRELWSNALDEGGQIKSITEETKGKKNTTTFYIQVLPEVRDILDNWSSYFAAEREIVYEDKKSGFKIYTGSHEKFVLYRNGIKVYEKAEPSVYHYDLNYVELNEMREVRNTYDISLLLARALSTVTDKKVIQYILKNIDGTVESKFDYDYDSVSFQESWGTAIGDAKIISKDYYEFFKDKIVSNRIPVVQLPTSLYKKLSRKFKDVSLLSISDEENLYAVVENEKLGHMITECIVILKKCGYEMIKDVKIKIAIFKDNQILGTTNKEDNTIILSTKNDARGLFDLCTTLVEENEHIITGWYDNTREFQQHFINKYVGAMLECKGIEL